MRRAGDTAPGPGGGRPRTPSPRGPSTHQGPPGRPGPAAAVPAEQRHRSPRREAALRRSPRPRVEVTFNELTGTASWRAVTPGGPARHGRAGAGGGEAHPGASRAAALRSPGGGAPGAPARGAAPIPVRPATVRAVVSTAGVSATGDRQGARLAQTALLRSQVQGDLSRAARMPRAVAARLGTTVPAHLTALSAARANTLRTAAGTPRPAAPAPPSPARRGPSGR
ncbi:hypothetical protein NC239_05720 [Streptomyces sp. G3]|uniref:hypothetical protein n=1 Tax=Streptomyces sp. G3 TaxID=690144 RepID=UPI00202F182C|nr:hypothetical protein [Streptomyces sp. G3]MCM1937713.1 hypothetical protein [Streptomyces sp. G3]